MSTNKSFEDRGDVPDLLKSLADYPFSFPDFEDTGKLLLFFFTPVVKVLLEQFSLLFGNIVLSEQSHDIVL